MCEASQTSGGRAETDVAIHKMRVVSALVAAGLRPNALTGFALLDLALTSLVFADTPTTAIEQRLADSYASAVRLKTAFADATKESQKH